MISPCNCKGSLKFVHESCLGIWMKKKINKQKLNEQKHEIPCEICRAIIQCQIETEFHLKTCSEIERKIKNHKILFIWAIFLWVFLFCFLGFMIFLVIWSRGSFRIFYSSATAICLITIVVYLYFVI